MSQYVLHRTQLDLEQAGCGLRRRRGHATSLFLIVVCSLINQVCLTVSAFHDDPNVPKYPCQAEFFRLVTLLSKLFTIELSINVMRNNATGVAMVVNTTYSNVYFCSSGLRLYRFVSHVGEHGRLQSRAKYHSTTQHYTILYIHTTSD